MRFYIIVYNPNYVNSRDVEILIINLRKEWGKEYFQMITHQDRDALPIYIINSNEKTYSGKDV